MLVDVYIYYIIYQREGKGPMQILRAGALYGLVSARKV